MYASGAMSPASILAPAALWAPLATPAAPLSYRSAGRCTGVRCGARWPVAGLVSGLMAEGGPPIG